MCRGVSGGFPHAGPPLAERRAVRGSKRLGCSCPTVVRKYWEGQGICATLEAGNGNQCCVGATVRGRAPPRRRRRSVVSFERASMGPIPAVRASACAARSECGPKTTSRGRSAGDALSDHPASRAPQPGSRASQSTNAMETDAARGRSAGESTRSTSWPACAAASAMRVAMMRSRATMTTRLNLPASPARTAACRRRARRSSVVAHAGPAADPAARDAARAAVVGAPRHSRSTGRGMALRGHCRSRARRQPPRGHSRRSSRARSP